MSASRLSWQGFTQWLPGAVLACLGIACAAVLVVQFGGMKEIKFAAALVVLGHGVHVFEAVNWRRWWRWPLGVASLAGLGAGIAMRYASWQKSGARTPFELDPAVYLVAAGIVAGWVVAAVFARGDRGKNERRERVMW